MFMVKVMKTKQRFSFENFIKYDSACRLNKLQLTLVTTHAIFHFVGNKARGRILKRR